MQSAQARAQSSGTWFVEPPWTAPLEIRTALQTVPAAATISGMFIAPLVLEAKRLGVQLPSARERYVPYRFYPLIEHVQVLVETCERIHPMLPIRQALRKLGRGAPRALVSSTLGKVVLAGAEGVHDVVNAMAKAYPLNARPSRVDVLERSPGRAIVRLEEVHYFIDSHHVGAFEGALRYAGVDGRVLIAARGPASADLLLEWDAREQTPSRRV
ncbi:MAG TPA: DUF2378 family protein [Polyangiaceae bacterium]|nr:DUF2378 family protein [Polyangiaceae bacterium]